MRQIIRKYPNFESYVASEVQKIAACRNVTLPEGGDHEAIRRRIEYSCLVTSNILGWSAYR